MTLPARPLESSTLAAPTLPDARPVQHARATTLRTEDRRASKLLRPPVRAAGVEHTSSVAGVLLETPARWLAELPAAPRLTLGTSQGVVVVGLDGSSADRAAIDVDAAAWLALVTGVEADRVWADDFARLVAPTNGDAAVGDAAGGVGDAATMAERALDGARPDDSECWTLRRVLARVGATLLHVELPTARAAA